MSKLKPRAPLPLLATLIVAACHGGSAERNVAAAPDHDAGNAAAPAVTPTPAATPTPPASAVSIKSNTGGLEFAYGWPAQVAAIPELDRWLRDNADKLRRDAARAAAADMAEARKNDYDMPDHSYQETWKVVGEGPALLILQSEGYVYTGGAHGMPLVTTLFWDKAAKRRLGAGDLFDMGRLIPAVRQAFCKALDDERAKRRGAPVDKTDTGGIADFVSCVDPAKQIVLPVAGHGGALDIIRFVILPYEAGPYAEGIYQLDLPVTDAVMAAVKSGYRGAFSVGG